MELTILMPPGNTLAVFSVTQTQSNQRPSSSDFQLFAKPQKSLSPLSVLIAPDRLYRWRFYRYWGIARRRIPYYILWQYPNPVRSFHSFENLERVRASDPTTYYGTYQSDCDRYTPSIARIPNRSCYCYDILWPNKALLFLDPKQQSKANQIGG